MTGMDDLVAFLRARLDEDEATARAAFGFDPEWQIEAAKNPAHRSYRSVVRSAQSEVITDDIDDGPAVHIARHDPARALREVEAKRRILEIHYDYRGVCPTCFSLRNPPIQREPYPCDTARMLALPYADHPDYRAEWRP
jgi:hypothetical protein